MLSGDGVEHAVAGHAFRIGSEGVGDFRSASSGLPVFGAPLVQREKLFLNRNSGEIRCIVSEAFE